MADVNTPKILDASTFRSFWISWEDGSIVVGQGNVVGQNVIMKYTDATPSRVNYIALSGWDAPGTVIIYRGRYRKRCRRRKLVEKAGFVECLGLKRGDEAGVRVLQFG